MRRYETVVILDPDLSEDGRGAVTDRIKEIIPQQGGTLIDIDEWGAKRLAYEIRKKQRGFYLCLDHCGSGPSVDEMERFFRIDDRVLKFMTLLVDEDADPEKILEERAAAKQAEDAAKAAAQPETSDTDADTSEPAAETDATADDTQAEPEADTGKEAS